MAKKRRGKTVKKNRSVAQETSETALAKAPHSFVVHRGSVGKSIQELTRDFRKVMEPFTASNIKVRPKNVVKDFVHVAGVLNVSHLVAFTKTEKSPYLKLARFPRGPTMTFRLKEYSLARDVRSIQKRQITYDRQFENHALLIMNNFNTNSRDMELMSSMFQNLFPSINVNTVKLSTVKRCVLLNYDEESQSIEFRHYTIKVVPTAVSKGVKKLVQGKIPNLGNCEDVSELFTGKAGYGGASDSEAEEDENSKVVLPQPLSSRGSMASGQSSIRLVELGPRITMELIKIEEGLLDGEVLYHKLVRKSEEEIRKIRQTREKRKREKEMRKAEQARNVKKKMEMKMEQKKKSLVGMAKTGQNKAKQMDKEKDDDSDVSDSEWYRREVGDQPSEELFDSSKKKGDSRKFTFGTKTKGKKSFVAKKSPKGGFPKKAGMKRKAPGKPSAKSKRQRK